MNFRKNISMMLAFCLLFIFCIPAYASDFNNDDTFVDLDIQNKMLRILSSVELEKEYYNLENVDFTAVQLGTEIPTYKVCDGILVKADISIVPIIYNDQIASLFYIADDYYGEKYVQLNSDLVDLINKNAASKAFAIIYDDIGVYIYTNEELKLLGEERPTYYTDDEKNYVSDVSNKELDEISISSISHYITLDVNQYTELESLAITSKYLSVEIISQPTNTNICWSIAITSIVNYIYNGSWNYQDIVNMFTNGLIEVYILNK